MTDEVRRTRDDDTPGLGNDPLLQPTVRTPAREKKPWRLASQGYVAFFGGILAGTVITSVNARRLGVSRQRQGAILAIGGLAVVVTLVGSVVIYDGDVGGTLRWGRRAVAVLAYLLQAWIQRFGDRAFQLRAGSYASLWGPGLAAVFGIGLVEGMVTGAVVYLFAPDLPEVLS